jgi:hypothetical protein
VHAIFTGLLVQSLQDPDRGLDGARITTALNRIADVLADSP